MAHDHGFEAKQRVEHLQREARDLTHDILILANIWRQTCCGCIYLSTSSLQSESYAEPTPYKHTHNDPTDFPTAEYCLLPQNTKGDGEENRTP